MRFALTPEYQDFFSQFKFIEFESLLNDRQVEEVYTSVKLLLAKRLAVQPDQLDKQPASALFKVGRDCWREEPAIKKRILSHKLCEIAATLFKTSPLRIGYDQVIHSTLDTSSLFPKPVTLQEISSLKEIVGAVVVRLSQNSQSLLSSVTGIVCPVPQKKGNLLFLSPQLPLSLDPLFHLIDELFIIVVFCRQKTSYVFQEKDYNTYFLKKQGYNFGDYLNNQTHPLVYKEF